MLRINVGGEEFFNEETQEFTTTDSTVVVFEHSLVSLSKWEAKYQVPFLTSDGKDAEQNVDYLQFMVVSPKDDPDVLNNLSKENLDEIQKYIDSSQTATTFRETPGQRGMQERITSELIYYWMIAFNIPFECETWHLNRLLTLIRICNAKQGKQKKLSPKEAAMRNRELNRERREKLGTSG